MEIAPGEGMVSSSLRRLLLLLGLFGFAAPASRAQASGADPFGSFQWPDLRRQYFGDSARVVFDRAHVIVQGPAFAEDSLNVPISVLVQGLVDVEQITVIVDRNPIRKVLEYFPVAALPRLSFRFKLEQASPVRAAVLTRDGVWHVGGTLVDAFGGGCTAPGQTQRDDSWTRSLGEVNAHLFPRVVSAEPGTDARLRLRLRLIHPMDTGLTGGIPAFYVNHLLLSDAGGRELLRMNTFEPVSTNPIFSFDFDAASLAMPLKLTGSDNNGNRIARSIE